MSVLIGAFAGWLAGRIMKSTSSGTVLNIILGIVGGYVGNWLFGILNISAEDGWLGSIITSTIGAIILIATFRFLKTK